MTNGQPATPDAHPFLHAPNRTLLGLTAPVLLSLIAEPLTGLVDTAFVAQLGSVPLAALGVGSIALSGVFWIFNFLGIGTQTEVSYGLGRDDHAHARKLTSLALLLGVAMGVLLGGLLALMAWDVAALLGATGDVQANAAQYIQIRMLGAPAVLIVLVGFGALRGLQAVRVTMWVALAINALNILLDPLLIYNAGMGVAGAALASVIAQTLGAVAVLVVVFRALGFTRDVHLRDAVRLLVVGRDLIVRTGLLTGFLLLSTRVATQIGDDAGAAHQAIRQVWVFAALALDALAMTAQSLVGYFYGSDRHTVAREVARLGARWSLGAGMVVAAVSLALTPLVIALLVPPEAVAVFLPAWVISMIVQPVNALAFITDGIHWGTSDYRYLRNAMIAATVAGGALLLLIDVTAPGAFNWVWVATATWIVLRAILGVMRVWPGVGNSPLRRPVAVGV